MVMWKRQVERGQGEEVRMKVLIRENVDVNTNWM